MDNVVEVTGGRGGNAFLILGKKRTALIDCGMAYCGEQLIRNIKKALTGRLLDYILISHTHYDHVGAIPFLKQEWPACQVLGAAYAKRVLNSSNALQSIRTLSIKASAFYGANLQEYDEKLLKVDQVIKDGDTVNLGGTIVKVYETLGHTLCSLSFLVNEKIVFVSESTGYMSKSGQVYPAFILSSFDAISSIRKCQELKHQYIVSPHYGLVNSQDTKDYWGNCLAAIQKTKEYILHLVDQGLNEDQILTKYEKVFRDEQSRLEQPLDAFKWNNQRMIQTVVCEKSVGF